MQDVGHKTLYEKHKKYAKWLKLASVCAILYINRST